MIKIVRPFFILVTALLLGVSAESQTALSGKVVEIIDGKTCVFETESGRVSATIQYVEVPEPEQPFSRMVREHLEKLVSGKNIRFVPGGFTPAALSGRLYLNDLDLGQQLVRDGAAWHLPAERGGQSADEAEVYAGHQALAKTERRGIWSIVNLTPPWEFRAGKGRTAGYSYTPAGFRGLSGEDKETNNYGAQKVNTDMWVEVGGEAFAQRNPAGLMFWGYDADKKIRNISTPSVAQVLANGDKRLEVEIRAIYFQREVVPRGPSTAFVLTMLATAREYNFAKDDSMSFFADGSEITIGSGQRFWRGNSASAQEMIQYRTSRSDLLKIAKANKLTIRIGQYSGTVGTAMRETIVQFIEAAR